MTQRRRTKTPPAIGSSLWGIAAIIGALAALAWPLVVILIRVRRIRLKLGPGGLEVELVPREAVGARHGGVAA